MSAVKTFISKGTEKADLSGIKNIVRAEIGAGRIPGAVVLVGTREGVLYRKAFGYRALSPGKRPMAVDTLFDLASVTKVIATTTAVMQLVEKKTLELDDPAAVYWPEFGSNGKAGITIRHLLTHYSGLRPDLDLKSKWSGYDAAIGMLLSESPSCAPGSSFIYSDINFLVLGELVRRVSGLSLDEYCQKNIFGPLGMKDTVFRPASGICARMAKTSPVNAKGGHAACGAVHDPTASRMGGVAGHAGLFSTVDDLSVFARMVLDKGMVKGVRILEPETVDMMTSPQSPSEREPVRGLGWEIRPAFAPNTDGLAMSGSVGHKGYTGTEVSIDPVSGTYYIILTNRVHMGGKGDAAGLRMQIAGLISEFAANVSSWQAPASNRFFSGYGYLQPHGSAAHAKTGVMTGIDVLEEERFAPFAGLRIGLITNHSGRDSSGRRTLDLLHHAKGLRISAVFSPEHGLSGTRDEFVKSSKDPSTGLPVYSLYGEVKRPTEKMLQGIDALVFDIQDAGARFYTYITTLGYAMEVAAKAGIPFYVLDRPNPITALSVQGPVLDSDLRSFTGYFPLPVRHGMTVGELASMFNSEYGINADLHVIRMKGYSRALWFDETGLGWVNPSPNLRSMTGAALYPGTALLEGANVSVGRGTDNPFELMGAPWIDSDGLVSYLEGRNIRGVRFMPVDFMPKSSVYSNKTCHGIRVILEDRNALDPVLLGIEMASALRRLYPGEFQVDKILGSLGSRIVLNGIKEGADPSAIALLWHDRLEEFRKVRSKYLLYAEK